MAIDTLSIKLHIRTLNELSTQQQPLFPNEKRRAVGMARVPSTSSACCHSPTCWLSPGLGSDAAST